MAPVITAVSVLVLGITLTWTFFSMRSVMNVGGSCADGGPYVSSQPCPDASFLIAIAIPVMLITAMVGSAAALSINAPNLLIPMWGVLFGSLGWNFLEFAFSGDDIVWGWLVCGVLFWLMAAPAVYGILVASQERRGPAEQATRRHRLALVGAGVRRTRRARVPPGRLVLQRAELTRAHSIGRSL